MKEKVVFETNVPVEVCLTNAEGKEIGGRRGKQIMYDLADGRLMFVPLSVRDQLRKLGIKPGERFQICRREVDDHGEEGFEWTVSRCVASRSQAPCNSSNQRTTEVPRRRGQLLQATMARQACRQ